MKRIVHLGLGNFHRAHQAWYTAKAGGWRITGVAMTNAKLQDEMAEAANRYLLGTWGRSGLSTEVIDVIDEVLLASQQGAMIVSKIADANTHIVTVTITEKGYHLSGGHLDLNAAAIARDLQETSPTSAIGLLSEGLIQRYKLSAGSISVVSCDNLSDNGAKLKQVVSDYVQERYPEAVPWLGEQVSFPATMVDRITPRLSAKAIDEICAAAGGQTMPVVGTEAFSEWIVEDRFAGLRPDWDAAGAMLVKDVTSFEQRKLRLLNGAHSFMAYAGLNKGHRYVHDAIADDEIRNGVCGIWEEASSTLSEPASQTVPTYQADLLKRFAVPALRHSLEQIAADGSVKLSERLLPVLQLRAVRKHKSPYVEAAIAAWAGFVAQRVIKDQIDDPFSAGLEKIVRENPGDPDGALVRFMMDRGTGE